MMRSKIFLPKLDHIGKFAVGTSKGGGNYFNLKATNGQIILTSLMYASLDDCNGGDRSCEGILH